MTKYSVGLVSMTLLTGCLTTNHLAAQGLFNSGQLIYVSNNTPITVQGDVQNKGTIINFGALSVSGDWNNRGSYNEGRGEVILNGTRTQSVTHRGQSFYRLVLNGSGEKIFKEDAIITSKLVFAEGILTPSPDSKLLVAETGSVEGGSTSSYVNGRLLQTGTGYKFFPVGKAGDYAPVTLVDITGIEPITGFEVFNPNPNTGREQGLKQVSSVRYWQKTLLSGSLSEAHIQLSFDSRDQFSSLNSVVVAEADGLSVPFRSLGQRTTSGDVASGSVLSKYSIKGTIFAVGLGADLAGMNAKVYIPNAFSPSSSHPEEKSLRVYGRLLSDGFLLRIYNRWGGLVFESHSLDEMQTEGWKGINRATGTEESLGVYTYTVQGKYEDGQSFKRAGTITLIR